MFCSVGDQSPPPTGRSGKVAGWYKDPSGRYDWRYFDGTWSDQVQKEGDDRTYIDPVPSPPRSSATKPPSTPSPAQATTEGLTSPPARQWWRRKLWKLPLWGWAALGIAALIGIAVGTRQPESPDTVGDATSRTPQAAETVADGSPAEPDVSRAALDFIDADECASIH